MELCNSYLCYLPFYFWTFSFCFFNHFSVSAKNCIGCSTQLKCPASFITISVALGIFFTILSAWDTLSQMKSSSPTTINVGTLILVSSGNRYSEPKERHPYILQLCHLFVDHPISQILKSYLHRENKKEKYRASFPSF